MNMGIPNHTLNGRLTSGSLYLSQMIREYQPRKRGSSFGMNHGEKARKMTFSCGSESHSEIQHSLEVIEKSLQLGEIL